MIPVMRPRLPDADRVAPWLRRMDHAGIYSNFGPLVTELEHSYARRFHVEPEQVVSVSSATLGIEGAIRTTNVDEWWVPDFTFPATGLAVLEADRRLVLCDVDDSTWELPDSRGAALNDHAGIIPVMAFGAPLDLDRWAGATHVIIDAAASLGTHTLDLSSLPQTWSVVFSLHATKVLPAGEGGIVVFGDAEAARTFRAWSNFGFRGTRESTVEGTNAKMSEIHAAYGLASLESWPEEREEWRTPLEAARAATLSAGFRSSRQDRDGVHPYWVVDVVTPVLAERLVARLTDLGIAHRYWWPSLSRMPAFSATFADGALTTSLRLSRTVVGMPMFRGIPMDVIERIGAELMALAKHQEEGKP